VNYIQRLAEITHKELSDRRAYCINNSNDKIIAGNAACEYFLRPHKNGGWRVGFQELGRGIVYEDYHFKTEREACIKFIEISEDDYHLSKYLSEFAN